MSDLRFGRLIPAMITPFDDALEVDFDRAQQLVDRLIKEVAIRFSSAVPRANRRPFP